MISVNFFLGYNEEFKQWELTMKHDGKHAGRGCVPKSWVKKPSEKEVKEVTDYIRFILSFANDAFLQGFWGLELRCQDVIER